MFDASQARDTSQQMTIVRMREAELRAAWHAANGRRPRQGDVGRTPRLRGVVAAGFIRIGEAVTELGRAVGRSQAA